MDIVGLVGMPVIQNDSDTVHAGALIYFFKRCWMFVVVDRK